MCTYRTWFVVGFSDPSDTVDILEWSSHDASPGFTKIESYGSRRLLCGVCAKANLSLVYMCMYLPVLLKLPIYIHMYNQASLRRWWSFVVWLQSCIVILHGGLGQLDYVIL